MSRRSSPLTSSLGTLGALALALTLAVALLVTLAPSPAGALKAFFVGPFSSGLAWGNLLNQALLLTLTGLAAALAFGAGTFNLGGEGQTYTGGLAALAAALVLPVAWGPVGTVAALGTGALAGALLGGLSGWLKVKFDADEMITTFLLSAAAVPLVDALMTGKALGAPESMLIQSRPAPEAFWIPGLLAPSNLHWGVLVALPLVVLFAILINHTPWGYRLRLMGRNRDFARYAGIPTGIYALVPLGLSGALHGLAGGLGVLGTQHALVQGFSSGWGWNGIAVALIARTNPWGVLPAAVLLAFLDQASRTVVLQGQFPFQLSALFQASILFFITARLVMPRFGRERRKS
jgi:simple sugar transport system permease protein